MISLFLLTALAVGFATQVTVASEPTVRDIVYGDTSEPMHRLDLYQPVANVHAPSPVIVWVHGGAWRSGSKSNVPVERWRQHGFAIASVDYRLSTQARFPAQIHDIKAAIRFLRGQSDRYQLDPRRIVLAGSSAGGHLAALAALSDGVAQLEGEIGQHASQPSQVQSVVSFFGASNLQTILSQSTEFGLTVRVPALQLLLGGQPEERPDLAMLASPVAHLQPSDPAVWLIHGDADPQMPLAQSKELFRECGRNGIPCRLDQIAGGKHGGDEFFTDTRLDELAEQLLERLNAPKPEAIRSETK